MPYVPSVSLDYTFRASHERGGRLFWDARPVQTLVDYLEEGDRLDGFLEDFPTVSREHAIAVLELATEPLISYASAA